MTWGDLSNETTYQVAIGTDGTTATSTANTTTYLRSGMAKRTYYVRVRGSNGFGAGAWSPWVMVPMP